MQQKISILEAWHERQGLVRCVTYFSKLKYTYQGSCHNSENYTNSTLLGLDNTISKQISLHQTTTASKIDLAPSIKMVTQNVNNTSMTTHKTNNRCWPSNLIDIIKMISSINCPAPRKQEFIFKHSTSATKTNWDIIQNYDKDITKAITAQHHSPLSFGSEFRPPNILNFILCKHLLWPRMKQLLTEGSS